MGREIVVRQPDGLFAVWLPDEKDFKVFDATPDDIDTYFVEKAIDEAQQQAMLAVAESMKSWTESNFLSMVRISNEPENDPEEDLEVEYRDWRKKWSGVDETG